MNRDSELTDSFARHFGGAPDLVARAPGRVNLIGEHTDYNDGFVLPMAIDQEIRLAARARPDRVVSLYSVDFGQFDRFSLDNPDRAAAGVAWANYPRGVARVLEEAGFRLRGLEATIAGNVPIGAGLSSSAALELATITVFSHLNDLHLDPVRAALLCQRAENEFVGVRCGIMDQFISALGRTGHALLVDCRSLEHTPVPLPPGGRVVVVDSGVRRGLVESAYNERRAQCEAAARLLGVAALRDADPEMLAAQADRLPAVVARRGRHVVEENHRVLAAVAALKQGDLAAFGTLLNASHASLRDLFEVSTPEIDALVEIQQQTPGCLGARLTGGGFGGCTVALVGEGAVEELLAAVRNRYPARTGRVPQTYVCDAVDGAGVVWRR